MSTFKRAFVLNKWRNALNGTRQASTAATVLQQPPTAKALQRPRHAVISTFDLFSIGIGPSSSHTVGPLRAANIFVESLRKHGLLAEVATLKVSLYGSLAATGKGHMSPEALTMGLEGEDCEVIDTDTIQPRYNAIRETRSLILGGTHKISFNLERDMIWHYDKTLERHPNGMLFSVFSEDGTLLASNTYFSIGGGFVISLADEDAGQNLYYKSVDKDAASPFRRENSSSVDVGQQQKSIESTIESTALVPQKRASLISDPPFLFHSGDSLIELCTRHNLTIAQLVWENERHYLSDAEIRAKLFKLYSVMDECIYKGVTSTAEILPGSLGIKRRARHLYKRLSRGLYMAPPSETPFATSDKQSLAVVHGRMDHALKPIPRRNASFPAMDILSCYAIAVNEVNAAGGRVVTAPTNGAAGIIPAVLKFFLDTLSENKERDLQTFLLTASAIGQLFKNGATISAAEGGCMAEVGVACAMAAGGFAACLGASPEIIESAAEIGIEHNLGLTCDPIAGLVQVPCIERNALGAVKAVTAANLALAGTGRGSISLDQAIAAMRQTATLMQDDLKETSRGGLAKYATSVRVPDC